MVDWTRNWTKKVKNNFSTFADDLPRPLRILEIGVWEARSALWMLDSLNPWEYVGVDPWTIDELDPKKFPRNEEGEAKSRAIEDLARKNLSGYYNAELIKGRSQDVLVVKQWAHVFRPESFGLIYIDGVHQYDPVTEDATNCWPLLQVGGVVVWDDCVMKRQKTMIQEAADAFLIGKPHIPLFRNGQFGVRKL